MRTLGCSCGVIALPRSCCLVRCCLASVALALRCWAVRAVPCACEGWPLLLVCPRSMWRGRRFGLRRASGCRGTRCVRPCIWLHTLSVVRPVRRASSTTLSTVVLLGCNLVRVTHLLHVWCGTLLVCLCACTRFYAAVPLRSHVRECASSGCSRHRRGSLRCR